MQAWATQHLTNNVHIPALSVDPEVALQQLEAIVQSSVTPLGVIGSSLGGFYANVLAAKYGLRAVLINPAVHPHLLLKDYVGVQENHHTGVAAEVRPEHFDFLEKMEVAPRFPQNLLVLLETGDETLDYRQAVDFYAGCQQDITEGGSHAYESFAKKLPDIVSFLNKTTLGNETHSKTMTKEEHE